MARQLLERARLESPDSITRGRQFPRPKELPPSLVRDRRRDTARDRGHQIALPAKRGADLPAHCTVASIADAKRNFTCFDRRWTDRGRPAFPAPK